jgi:hypothetical protein
MTKTWLWTPGLIYGNGHIEGTVAFEFAHER